MASTEELPPTLSASSWPGGGLWILSNPHYFILAQKGTNAGPSSAACPTSHLFVLLHGGVELLRQVVGHVGHAGLLLVGSADAAFILVGFLVVLFLGILAVTLAALQQHIKLSDKSSLFQPSIKPGLLAPRP